MIRFLAVDFNQVPPAAVVARVHRERPIEIVALGSLDEITDTELESDQESGHKGLRVALPDGGVDRAHVLLSGREVIYTSVELPFNDPKKLAQVVPLQLQDSLPFDISQCIVDTNVVEKPALNGDSQKKFHILAALTQSQLVAETLRQLKEVGVDPIHVSTQAASLVSLFNAVVPIEDELCVALSVQDTAVSFAAIHNGQALALREWSEGTSDFEGTAAEIRASIEAQERLSGKTCRHIYVIGSNEAIQRCREAFRPAVALFSLSDLVENHTGEKISLDRLAWALGLAASERAQTSGNRMRIDFRKGPFAYHRAWSNLWEAFAGEIGYILLAVVFGCGLLVTKWWTSEHRLNQIENQIQQYVRAALPGEVVSKRREVQHLEELVADRENQLREMGSLSSLSSLESLRELSTAITTDIPVEIESLTIGFSRILLRGSVADTPAAGRLETALKRPAEKFCAVTVDLQGQETSSTRKKFLAEIEVCE